MSKPNQIYNPKWNSYIELWRGIQPPWRPNRNQLGFYLKYLKKYLIKQPKPKVLIFGSTPETRQLCSELKLEVICFDANKKMYHGMKKLMQKEPYNEKFVLGKWENTNQFFQENEFDVIFSDCTHGNMAFQDWLKNFKDIHKIIKEDGLYFNAETVMHLNQKMTFERVLEKYHQNREFFNNFQNKIDVFYQMSAEYAYDWDTRGVLFSGLRKKIKDWARDKNIDFQEISAIWPIKDDIETELAGEYTEVDPFLGEVYELIIPHFWIKGFYIDRSHPVYHFRRDMVLRPRK